MKRVLSLFLAILMVLSLCTVSIMTASAASTAKTVTYQVKKGDYIRYTYKLTCSDKIASLDATVDYSDNLELVREYDEEGSFLKSIFPKLGGVVSNFENDGYFLFNASNYSGTRFVEGNNVLINAVFYATADGTATITTTMRSLADVDLKKIVHEYEIVDSARYNTSHAVTKEAGYNADVTYSDNNDITQLVIGGNADVTLTNCTKLKTVTLGVGVTSFTATGCSALENIYVSENNPTFTSIDGILFSKSQKSIMWYPAGRTDEEYTLPSTVAKVGVRAFYGATNLKKIYFSSALTTISERAFWGCKKLSSVIVNKKLKTVGKYAFVNCTSLKTLSVPKTLSSIGSKAYGYKYSSSKWSKISTFTIRGYKSTKVYSHAKSNSLKFSDITPTKATLNKTSITLGVGQTYTLTATISPSNKVDVSSWSTSSKSVCTVSSSGVITAKKAGTATITFKTSNGKKATCKVTVKKAPTQLYLNKYSATISVNKTVNLDPKFKSGYYAAGVKFESADTSIATVSSTGVVKGIKKGTVTITASTYNGLSRTCTITVK